MVKNPATVSKSDNSYNTCGCDSCNDLFIFLFLFFLVFVVKNRLSVSDGTMFKILFLIALVLIITDETADGKKQMR